jgi:hypothetical protein
VHIVLKLGWLFLLLLFFFWWELRALSLQKQVVLEPQPSPFCSGYFGSRTTCPGWPQTAILLISAITGVSHKHLTGFTFNFSLVYTNCTYELSIVAHACNPSYSGGGGRNVKVWGWPQGKSETLSLSINAYINIYLSIYTYTYVYRYVQYTSYILLCTCNV